MIADVGIILWGRALYVPNNTEAAACNGFTAYYERHRKRLLLMLSQHFVTFVSVYIKTVVLCTHPFNCLSNALHSSTGQNIKSHAVSGLRYPVSGVRSPARV